MSDPYLPVPTAGGDFPAILTDQRDYDQRSVTPRPRTCARIHR